MLLNFTYVKSYSALNLNDKIYVTELLYFTIPFKMQILEKLILPKYVYGLIYNILFKICDKKVFSILIPLHIYR